MDELNDECWRTLFHFLSTKDLINFAATSVSNQTLVFDNNKSLVIKLNALTNYLRKNSTLIVSHLKNFRKSDEPRKNDNCPILQASNFECGCLVISVFHGNDYLIRYHKCDQNDHSEFHCSRAHISTTFLKLIFISSSWTTDAIVVFSFNNYEFVQKSVPFRFLYQIRGSFYRVHHDTDVIRSFDDDKLIIQTSGQRFQNNFYLKVSGPPHYYFSFNLSGDLVFDDQKNNIVHTIVPSKNTQYPISSNRFRITNKDQLLMIENYINGNKVLVHLYEYDMMTKQCKQQIIKMKIDSRISTDHTHLRIEFVDDDLFKLEYEYYSDKIIWVLMNYDKFKFCDSPFASHKIEQL